jgi:hypothetical protein
MKLVGRVKGQAIEFDCPLGLSEGQTVEIEIRTVDGTAIENERDASLRDSPAYRTFRPIPAGGRVVTNEMVNEIREELGI